MKRKIILSFVILSGSHLIMNSISLLSLVVVFVFFIASVLLARIWFLSDSAHFFSLEQGQIYTVLSSHVQRFNDPEMDDRNYVHILVGESVGSFYISMGEVEGGCADKIEFGDALMWDYVSGCPFFKKKKVFKITPERKSGGGVILA